MNLLSELESVFYILYAIYVRVRNVRDNESIIFSIILILKVIGFFVMGLTLIRGINYIIKYLGS